MPSPLPPSPSLPPHPRRQRRHGFTLVEISIVLVIIGLVVGGLLVGQDMVRAAEMNSIVKDMAQFKIAVNDFRSKYNYYPGDLPTATSYWPQVAGGCTTQAGTNAQTCNGNGSGTVTFGFDDGGASYYEMFRFWQQLSLSGLLPGSYSGAAGPLGASEHVAGVNTPASRFKNATYSVFYGSRIASHSGFFDGAYGHFFSVGKHYDIGHPWQPLFTTAQAFNIDTKLDDGSPGNGNVVANDDNGCTTSTDPRLAQYTTGAAAAVSCYLHFRNAF